MSILYGISIQPSNDPYITAAGKAVRGAVIATVPGAFLVDAIPWLRWVPEWMPGAGFQKKAREWKKYAEVMLNRPFETTKREVVRILIDSTRGFR
jgi:hypothetical protein